MCPRGQNVQPRMSVKDRELEELLRNASRFFRGNGSFNRATGREAIKSSEEKSEAHERIGES